MKFQLTTTKCLALLAVLDQSNAFSPRAFAISSATLSPTKLRMSTSAQEEVAKMKAAAARMREEAAQLEKVRMIENLSNHATVIVVLLLFQKTGS
jgi:hypothetical protein